MLTYTINWNEKEACWIARFKKPRSAKPIHDTWGTKWCPKTIGRKRQIEAETYFLQWHSEKYPGVASDSEQIHPVVLGSGGADAVPGTRELAMPISIAFLAERWLRLRFNDGTGTKLNTYRGFKSSLKNWILDNAKFPHFSIQNLDIETELTVQDIRAWILSIRGSRSNKIQQINTLRSMLNDCQAEEWLSEDFTSPFDKKAVSKIITELMRNQADEKEDVTFIEPDAVATLLTKVNKKVSDYRRIRYLLAIATGMRDQEIQGLVWSDLSLDAEIPSVYIQRQLVKIGVSPYVTYEDLSEKGLNKDEVQRFPNALVSNPKKNSKRVIPLHPLLVAALGWWKSTGWRIDVGRNPVDSDPVFARAKVSLHLGQVAGSFTMTRGAELLRADLQRLQLPLESSGESLVFHSLRHTFSTLLDGSGCPEERISAMLGHGAASISRRDYIAKYLPTFATDVARLPLPTFLQLERCKIEAAKVAGSGGM